MWRKFVSFSAASGLVLMGSLAYAQQRAAEVAPARAMPALTLYNLLISVVYGLLGIALLIIGYYIFELVTPFSTKKELVEDQNVAIGLVVASMIMGMAIVIAAAIV